MVSLQREGFDIALLLVSGLIAELCFMQCFKGSEEHGDRS